MDVVNGTSRWEDGREGWTFCFVSEMCFCFLDEFGVLRIGELRWCWVLWWYTYPTHSTQACLNWIFQPRTFCGFHHLVCSPRYLFNLYVWLNIRCWRSRRETKSNMLEQISVSLENSTISSWKSPDISRKRFKLVIYIIIGLKCLKSYDTIKFCASKKVSNLLNLIQHR